MKISFYNIGCKVNFAEMAQIEEQFRELGHEIVGFGTESDVVLINTCTVTKHADADCRKVIRRAQRQSPHAFIGVMGCYAQLGKDEISEIEGVDAVFGINEKFSIPDLIGKFEKKSKAELFVGTTENIPFHFASSADDESHTRKFFKIQDGCDYTCSYCTIPMARGASRSMDFAELRSKLDNLGSSSFHEIILSGINLGEYLSEGGETFTDVIRHIAQLDAPQRFRISSIEPNLLSDEIIRLTRDSENLCKHFHIPLQSGSAEILRLMRRRYNLSTFATLIGKIKSEIPDCGIGIDLIAGFPGETDNHYRETYDFLESLPFSYLHVFTYSERENTDAVALKGAVPNRIRQERTHLLRELSDRKKREFLDSQIGKISRVIPEKYNAETGRWTGWSDNYLRTEFEAPEQLGAGIYPVRFTEMIGEHALAVLCNDGQKNNQEK